jgi:hypothetical protein
VYKQILIDGKLKTVERGKNGATGRNPQRRRKFALDW